MNKNKRILLVSLSDNTDHQNCLYSLTEEARKYIDCFSIGLKNPKVEYDFDESSIFVDAPLRPGISKNMLNMKMFCKIVDIIIKIKPDYIYFESLHIWNVFIMMRFRKIKFVHSIHDVVPHNGGIKGITIKAMNYAIARLADIVLLRNKKYIDYFSKVYNVSCSRIRYIDVLRKFPPKEKCHNTNRVLYFGRIDKYKGLDSFYHVVAKMPDVTFDIVGKTVDQSLVPLIEKYKNLKNVNVDNTYVSEEKMKWYFYQSDCVVIPYNSASQSGVIIDAYKYSRPVVAYETGAIGEQVDVGNTGYLVKSGDMDNFSSAIYKIINNKDKEKLCELGYKFGYDKYSTQSNIHDFLSIFD